jgi:hypothetical protein
MVARFTMDTATSFLFGQDVRSLDAGLPYPDNAVAGRPVNLPAVHPSSAFATAFQDAQMITSLRARLGAHWPLAEFWDDKLAKPMGVVRGFLDPILKEAVAKKRAMAPENEKTNEKELGDRQVQEGETLLDHLVDYTDGMCLCSCSHPSVEPFDYDYDFEFLSGRPHHPPGRDPQHYRCWAGYRTYYTLPFQWQCPHCD